MKYEITEKGEQSFKPFDIKISIENEEDLRNLEFYLCGSSVFSDLYEFLKKRELS